MYSIEEITYLMKTHKKLPLAYSLYQYAIFDVVFYGHPSTAGISKGNVEKSN
jgi:hypothetical protein